MNRQRRIVALALGVVMLVQAPGLAFTVKIKRAKDESSYVKGTELGGSILAEYGRAMKGTAFTGHIRLALKCSYKGLPLHIVHSHCRSIQEAEALAMLLTRHIKRKSLNWIRLWKLRKTKSGNQAYWIAELVDWECTH